MEIEKLDCLKIISVIGGINEIIFGMMMLFFIVPLLKLIGLNIDNLEYPIFSHTSGLLAIILGLILLFSSFNIEKFLLNICLITILRFAIQIVLIVNIFLIPSIMIGLIFFGIIDLVFAIINILLIKKSNLTLNFSNLIK